MPDVTPEVIRVRIPGQLEQLERIDRMGAEVCARAGFDEDECSQFTLAVIEAGTNAIQHGSRGDPAKEVEIVFTLLPDRLEVRVTDQGPGFDPTKVSTDVTSPEHLLDARGRGIFIMRSCCDDVDYEFGASGTTCRLVKRRVHP